MIEHTKEVYRAWVPIRRNMPRTERFGIGERIDSRLLGLMELLRKASYSAIPQKIAILEQASLTTDSIRFFLQLAWEVELMPNVQYAPLANTVEEIGRMIGGWRKGLITKTSASSAEERRR